MKTQKTHTTVAAIVIGMILMTMSCGENNALIKPTNQVSASQAKPAGQPGSRIMNYTFDGTEGGAIMLGTASSWIANYNGKNPQSVKSHFFGAKAIQKILADDRSIGMRIYYSLDDGGNKQLLLVGTDRKGNDLLLGSRVRGKVSSADLMATVATVSLTDTDGDLVSETTSKQWMTNHNTKNSSSLIAHFFGTEIVNQIIHQTGCIGIRMYYALNDAGVQQVLLIGVNAKGKNILPSSQTGRVEGGDGVIGDMSYPCPSYCPGSGS